jgi:ribosomal protein S18 acetylase RimI-like enzyme
MIANEGGGHTVLRGAEAAADAVGQAHALLGELVSGGAALGWVEPPSRDEIATLCADLAADARVGDAALRFAYEGDRLVGLGYWRRYARPTHRPNADLEKLAVAPSAHGRGIGRRLVAALIEDAEAAGVEFLTLDARGDNANALRLYRSLGFTEYGRLTDFVAVGQARYDKVFYVIDLRTRESAPG